MPKSKSWRFSLMLSTESIVFCFRLKSMIHFELIFVECVRFSLRFLFCFVFFCFWCPIAPFVEESTRSQDLTIQRQWSGSLVSFCFVSNKCPSLWHRCGGDKCVALLRVDYDLRVTQWHQYLFEGWGAGGDLAIPPALATTRLEKRPTEAVCQRRNLNPGF